MVVSLCAMVKDVRPIMESSSAACTSFSLLESRALVETATFEKVLTGAGISTAAGIPDFRGPSGVWTAEAYGRAAPEGTSLELAQPTLTHMALVALQGRGVIDAVISQNIDGLHLRSRLPPHCLHELHGNSFMERCRRCRKTHFRPFDVKGMSFKPTGRWCEGVKSAAARLKRARDSDGHAGGAAIEACGGALHDMMLEWGDALPPAQLKESERLCKHALCLLCLGTSLYINPCGLLPTRTKKAGGKVAIVALSGTAVMQNDLHEMRLERPSEPSVKTQTKRLNAHVRNPLLT
jgi:mono-ADP-ribosyltransferase sirtuin 6